MKRIIIMVLITSLMLPSLMAGTTKIYPNDDAFVRDGSIKSSYANTKYGMTEKLDLRAGYISSLGKHKSYFKFNVAGLQNVNSIKFSIDPTSKYGSPTLELRYVSSNNWEEDTITWNTAPGYSTLVDSLAVTNNDRIYFDVDSSLISEKSEISFVLIEDNNNAGMDFASKDWTTGVEGDEFFWPYLEINYGEGSECPSENFDNVCCQLNPIQMMGLINAFNNFETNYSPIQTMGFINKFNNFEELC